MPSPTPGIIGQIVNEISSPAWLFSVLFVGLIVGIVAALIATRLDRRLAYFSEKRRNRFDRLDKQRENLGVAIINRPHLQLLVAHRIAILNIWLVICWLAIVLIAIIGNISLKANDFGVSAGTPPVLFFLGVPTVASLAAYLFLLIIVLGIIVATRRVQATSSDLSHALQVALTHDESTAELRALDAERRAAGDIAYYFDEKAHNK